MSLRQSSLLSVLDRRTAAVTIVSLAALMGTYLVTSTWKAIHTDYPATPKTIEVQGQAQRRLPPDHVTWTFTVHGRGSDQAAAMNTLRENVKAAHEYLRAHAIADAELSYGTPTANDASDSMPDDDSAETTPTTTWDATQDIDVSLGDLKRAVAAHDAATITDALGDTEVSELACTATVPESANEALLGEARKDVRARAKTALGQFGGAKLGHLVNASIGSVEIGSECAGVTMTATANATYELE